MSDYTLPPLPYEYSALEPYISGEIMTIHHTKHHQAYINALKTAEQSYASASSAKERIALQAAIKFNGGGHINHSLFWKNLAPANTAQSTLKDGPLKQAIDRDFGSLDKLKTDLNAAAAAVQGSGWGWLVYNTKTGKTEILTLPNQDPVLPPYVPLIGIDVWEHAYYLQYKNVRPDYLKAIWNVVNFEEAEKRLQEATGGSKL
ncbi:manganese superoxide dismutase [Auricularia subglabra TFB-10046 SS5]|nr:manganese superoxide dismutase [Auricularia subglabra TFB-10046 SS5]